MVSSKFLKLHIHFSDDLTLSKDFRGTPNFERITAMLKKW